GAVRNVSGAREQGAPRSRPTLARDDSLEKKNIGRGHAQILRNKIFTRFGFSFTFALNFSVIIQEIKIYTDGAARGNPGPGGFGIVMIAGKHRKEYSEGYRMTTNNRMELLAVIRALELLKTAQYPITIYSDSKYVVDAIEKKWVFGWAAQGFKNKKNP